MKGNLYLIPGLRRAAETLGRIAWSPPVAFLGIFGQMLHPPSYAASLGETGGTALRGASASRATAADFLYRFGRFSH